MSKLTNRQFDLQNAAIECLAGKLGADTRDNYCLQFVRLVVEKALKLKPRGFYAMVSNIGGNPYAAEIEDQIRRYHSDWLVTSPQVGDLVFWHDLPKGWGHVGIITDINGNGILEVAQNTTRNTNIVRQYKGALKVIGLSDMPKPTTIVRLPEVKV